MNRVFYFNETNCPQGLIDNGINCKCPFNIAKRGLDLDFQVDVPDISKSKASWMSEGDYVFDIKSSDNKGEVLCLKVYFTIKKPSSGK